MKRLKTRSAPWTWMARIKTFKRIFQEYYNHSIESSFKGSLLTQVNLVMGMPILVSQIINE